MNRLENVETQFTEDELTIKFYFKKALVHLRNPLFFEKSIQVDFPLAYSQPAKRFLKTGDSQISQIYVSQFNSRTMRVRFILGKDEEGEVTDPNVGNRVSELAKELDRICIWP